MIACNGQHDRTRHWLQSTQERMIIHPGSQLACRCLQTRVRTDSCVPLTGSSIASTRNTSSRGAWAATHARCSNAATLRQRCCTACLPTSSEGTSTANSKTSTAQTAAAPAGPNADAVVDPEQYEYMEFRGKWMLDGAGSVEELVQLLLQNVEWFQQLQADGWTLCKPIMHDVGQLRCPIQADEFDASKASTFTVQTLQAPGTDTTVFPSLYHSPEHDAAHPAADVGGIGELSEAEVEYRASDTEEVYERMPVSAQNLLDGCEDVSAVVSRLMEHMDWVQGLEAEGWRLERPVDDDQGWLVRPRSKKQAA